MSQFLQVPVKRTPPTRKQKKQKEPKAPHAVKAAKLPAHQALDQSLTSGFAKTVNASHSDISDAMRNLGFQQLASSHHSERSSQYASDADSLKEERKSSHKSSHSSFKNCTYNLRDFSAMEVLESLLIKYGSAGHMGVRDQSYSFFINPQRTAALYYKVLDKVAVVVGDPLCEPGQYVFLIKQFKDFCKKQHIKMAMMAVSDEMAEIAQEEKWITMRFGVEKILNPMDNPLLRGTSGKRTVSQCNKLLESGMSVDLYCPSYQYDAEVEEDLVRIYGEWRTNRDNTRTSQAFMTVFDILSLPRLMAFIYTKEPNGRMNGFAALRKLGHGFHIDPFIATPDAPRGTVDLLIFASMTLCNKAGLSHLSMGFEPLNELAEITGLPMALAAITRKVHNKIFGKLPLGGKKLFYSRFHPDESQEKGLHMVFLEHPGIRHMMAMMHFANISLRSVIAASYFKHSVSADLTDHRSSTELHTSD